MANSKVILQGETLIDLTADTITASVLSSGYTATVADGQKISGSAREDFEDRIVSRTISEAYTNSLVTYVSDFAFARCINLPAVSFPNCISIGTYAFLGCYDLISASFPVATTLGTGAFQGCFAIQEFNFPNVSIIYSICFQECYSLTAISLPKFSSVIPGRAFSDCYSLTNVYVPNATAVGDSAFYNCSCLANISLPKASYISVSAFMSCVALQSMLLPEVTKCGYYAFKGCTSLSCIIFPKVSSLGYYTFTECYRLVSFYVLSSSVARMETAIFGSTPIGGYSDVAGQYGSIYVRSSLVTAYQSAAYWSAYSSRFVGLTDAQIISLIGYLP